MLKQHRDGAAPAYAISVPSRKYTSSAFNVSSYLSVDSVFATAATSPRTPQGLRLRYKR
jgi:hypothetical protein